MNMKDTYLQQCLALIDEQEILDFTASLVQIPSFPPAFNERDVALVVAKKFSDYGIPSELEEVGPNRANILAAIGEKTHPNIVFSGHMDTVPPEEVGWNYPPFGAVIDNGKMYGRGTCDMKGGVAALVMAICYLKKSGIPLPCKLSFLGTAGEDAGLEGSLHYIQHHDVDEIDSIVIAEASNKDMYITQMGTLWLKFTAKGIAAHPGVAHHGVNALQNSMKFFERFVRYDFGVAPHPLLGLPTLSVTTMHAGQIINTLPTLCTSTVDIRTVPGVRHRDITAACDRIIADLKEEDPRFDLSYEVVTDYESSETQQNDPLCLAAFRASRDIFGREIKAAGTFFNTDACVMRRSDGTIPPLVVYGPGDPSNNHKVNEFVPVDELVDSVKFYMALLLNFLDEQPV